MTSWRTSASVALVLCLLACAHPAVPVQRAAAPTPAPKVQRITLSIIATNDVHGHLEQLPLLGGYLLNLRRARAADGAVLLLDAGDVFQGTLESNSTEGASMVRAYDALGYAAVAVGNHEFDFGPEGAQTLALSAQDDPLGALAARVAQAHFSWVSANLRAKGGEPFPLGNVARSVMLQAAGIRVGVVGGLTMDALMQTAAPNVAGLELAPLTAAVASEASALRQRGAQLVIALLHAGGECRDTHDPDDLSSCDPEAEVFQLARGLPQGSVDLIVSGHTHERIAHRVAGIAVIESGANARAFGRVDLLLEKTATRATILSERIFEPHPLCAEQLDAPACTRESYENAPVQRDPAVLRAISADVEAVRALRAKALGVELPSEVARAGAVESPLGNLVAELLLRAVPGADAAINNAGSLRASLPAGPLTYGSVFEMFPFDNTLATVQLPASALAAIVGKNLQSGHGILALAGVRAEAHCEGTRLSVQLLGRDGRALAPSTPLRVVLSDYLASRGEGLLQGLVDDPAAVTILRDRPMRDALIAGLQALPAAQLDARSRTLFDPQRPRIAYPGSRPVRCTPASSSP